MVFLILLLSQSALAGDSDVCISLVNYKSVLDCVSQHSPEIAKLSLERDAALSESHAIKKWINPEVWNQSLFGINGQQHSELQFGLWQTFELSSKWNYKNVLSKATEDKAAAMFAAGYGEEIRKVASDLVRLGQLQREIASLDEATQMFNRLLTQFSSSPSLAPDQEVSVSVYKLSKGDFSIRRNILLREQDEIEGRFRSKFQFTPDQIKKISYDGPIRLPDQETLDFKSDESPAFKIIDAELALTQANVSLAKSDYFSEVKLGPVAQLSSDAGIRSESIGFQVSIPFPLWNQNGYGIDTATKRLKAAEVGSQLRRLEIQDDWSRALRDYGRLKTLLNSIPSPNEMTAKHKKAENQIYRGLVNSALVVESHRSLIDLQKSRDEAELEAINIWWKILIFQGHPEEIQL